MKYQKLINDNIKYLRMTNGFTQEEFAEKIGISIQGVSNIERNKYQPNSETIDRICKVFKITPIQLLALKCNNDKHNEIITNIVSLLQDCTLSKLKQIYKILLILVGGK